MTQSLLTLPIDDFNLSPLDKKHFAAEQKLGMVQPQDPVLTKHARALRPTEITAPATQAVIAKLFEAAGAQQHSSKPGKSKRMLVGLAAPQIGESLRIILVDTTISPARKEPGKLECFINPEIIWESRQTVEDREGCFSAGPVWGLVRRPVAVKIKAVTPDGMYTERIFEGFTARIIRHECDHLDGIRFADRITSDRKRHWVHAEELSEYPLHIKHWPRHCSRERWEAFKRGTIET